MKYCAEFVGIVFLTLSFHLSCSPGKVTVNSSESRQILIGKVIHNDHSVAQNALVSLFDVKITSDYDSIYSSYSTTTSNNGYFILKDIPDGKYLLYVYDTAVGKCNLSQIQKNQASFQFESDIILEPLITMKGKIISTEQCSVNQVLIPGFGASAQVDEGGYFTLSEVPAGRYDLVLIGKTFIYVSIKISKISQDTVFLSEINPCSAKHTASVCSNLGS